MKLTLAIQFMYSVDQRPLVISCHSGIVAAPSDMQNEIVAALEFYPQLIFQ